MSPGIDSEESIPPFYVAWRAGMTNRVVIAAHQAGNRFLGSLKGLQIRTLRWIACIVQQLLSADDQIIPGSWNVGRHDCYSFYIFVVHTFIDSFKQSYVAFRWGSSPSPYRRLAEWKKPPGVPSRDLNSGLPYSKPTHYQPSYTAPYELLLEVFERFGVASVTAAASWSSAYTP